VSDAFSLTALIAEVCDESDVVNVEKVAHEVATRIRPADIRTALDQALVVVVRHWLTGPRRSTQICTTAEGEAEVLTPRPGRSWKRDGVREHWRRALTEKYSIDRKGNAVPLAELNRAQVQFNIDSREEFARRASARASQLRGLLELMVRHDVNRVGDLPESVLSAVLVSAA
jgi:hypothetical protein